MLLLLKFQGVAVAPEHQTQVWVLVEAQVLQTPVRELDYQRPVLVQQVLVIQNLEPVWVVLYRHCWHH